MAQVVLGSLARVVAQPPQDAGRDSSSGTRARHGASLSPRETEVLELMADGLSIAAAAVELEISPETVRTHVRNAMRKLGATTRSHAIAIAMQERQIGPRSRTRTTPGGRPVRAVTSRPSSVQRQALQALLRKLVRLYDVDGGAVFLVDGNDLRLRRIAYRGDGAHASGAVISLGQGAIGRAALEQRAQLMPGPPGSGRAMIIAPMLALGTLVGVISLITRPSRPAARRELLLLDALASRAGQVVAIGGEQAPERLTSAFEHFRAGWAAMA